MLYLTQSLNNVSTFQLIETNNLYYFSLNSELVLFNVKKKHDEWRILLNTQHVFFVDEKYLYPYWQYRLIYKIDKMTGIKICTNESDINPVNVGQSNIWIEFGLEKEYYFAQINKLDFTVEKKWKLGTLRVKKVLENYVICQQSMTFITCHSFTNGAELWRIELPNPLISQLIVVDEKLFLVEESGKLLCLDVSTGKVLWQELLNKFWLVEHQGLLYSARQNSISIINPDTNTIQTIDYSASMTPEGLEFSWNGFGVDGDYLYFIDNGRPRVGLIYLPNGTLVWFTAVEIPEGEYHILEVKMKNDRLYVLVQGGILHIFERE